MSEVEQLKAEIAGYKADQETWINGYKGLNIEVEHLKLKIEQLTEELKDLDWYKMWHGKFKTEIEQLTLELETYRPTKLSGHGQCKCSDCGCVSWTDWFSRYKGKTLCDKCLKEIVSNEEKQTVKDVAKEIFDKIFETLCSFVTEGKSKEYAEGFIDCLKEVDKRLQKLAKEQGVEVE